MKAALTLGPVLFNWPEEKLRDFYFRMADEAPVETVYLGEVVCAKRIPFRQADLPEILERLQCGGKRVVLSTLALIMNARDLGYVKAITEMVGDLLVEANDLSAISLLKGQPFTVGPYVNCYNEATLHYFETLGAKHITLPVELNADSLKKLAAARQEAELEVQVFGRLPLAIASRCYHARVHRRHKDNCQYVCEKDCDGMVVDTLDNQHFLTINGLQTLSYTYAALTREVDEMRTMGIRHFRLSPHDTDMVAIARYYQALMDGVIDETELLAQLSAKLPEVTFSNGFYHGREGIRNII